MHFLRSMIKSVTLTLALIFTLNSLAWAGDSIKIASSISQEREEELFEIAENNPAEVLSKMTDAELLQVAKELKLLIQDIQRDFSAPDVREGDRLGFKTHEWSKVSIPLAVALTAIGILSRTKAFKNSPDNPATYLVILILGLGVTAVFRAGNDNMVWMTAEEAQSIQERIMRLRKLSLIVDRQLK